MPPPRSTRRRSRRTRAPRAPGQPPTQWQLLERPLVASRVSKQALAAGLIASFLLNLGLIWIAIVTLSDVLNETNDDLFRSTAGASLELGLTLNTPKKSVEPEVEELVPVPVPVKPEYVEANPDANNDFAPEETMQESFQNQVAAQEDPDFLAEGEMPTIEDGEVENSPKIVTGSLEDPSPPTAPQGEPVPPQPDAQPEPEPAQTPPPSPPPAPDFLQQEPQTPEGPGSTPFEPSENPEPVEEPVERLVDLFLPEVPPVEQPADQPSEQTRPSEVEELPSERTAQTGLPDPRPRPRLDAAQVPTGMTRISDSVAARAGAMAVNSRLSKFGLYNQRFNEAIYRRWILKLENYPFTPSDSGSKVVVTGELDPNGNVHNLRVVESNGTRQFTLICEDAIFENAPYGPWTEDMLRVFGERETFSVTFRIR